MGKLFGKIRGFLRKVNDWRKSTDGESVWDAPHHPPSDAGDDAVRSQLSIVSTF